MDLNAEVRCIAHTGDAMLLGISNDSDRMFSLRCNWMIQMASLISDWVRATNTFSVHTGLLDISVPAMASSAAPND